MSTAEQKMGRAWLLLLAAIIVGGVAFIGTVAWVAWALLKAVGLL